MVPKKIVTYPQELLVERMILGEMYNKHYTKLSFGKNRKRMTFSYVQAIAFCRVFLQWYSDNKLLLCYYNVLIDALGRQGIFI